MKSIGLTLIGGFLFMATIGDSDKDFPQVKKIQIDERSFENIMMDTELYKQTVKVEDTIMETSKIIKEIKYEKAY